MISQARRWSSPLVQSSLPVWTMELRVLQVNRFMGSPWDIRPTVCGGRLADQVYMQRTQNRERFCGPPVGIKFNYQPLNRLGKKQDTRRLPGALGTSKNKTRDRSEGEAKRSQGWEKRPRPRPKTRNLTGDGTAVLSPESQFHFPPFHCVIKNSTASSLSRGPASFCQAPLSEAHPFHSDQPKGALSSLTLFLAVLVANLQVARGWSGNPRNGKAHG